MSSEESDIEFENSPRPRRGRKKRREATYEEYITLARAALYPTGGSGLGFRRDIFSGDLLYFDFKKDAWVPVMNRLSTIKSVAAEYNSLPAADDDEEVRYSLPRFEDHLDREEARTGLRFVPDIPEWDGVDRANIMSRCLLLREESPVQVDEATELVKDWLARAWQRLYDPATRNRLLCVCGPQKIGKDWWLNCLIGGAGQWVNDLPLAKQGYDQDSERSLSQGLFLKIGEFDKCNAVDSSRLKDMIDKPFTSTRMAYDRRAEKRACRSSFCASANTADLLRDWTGATKYILLEVSGVVFKYGNTPADSLQLLAQAKRLADQDYHASKDTERRLKKLLDDNSPDDPSGEIVDLWFDCVRDYAAKNLSVSRDWENENFIPLYQASSVLRDIADRTGNRLGFVKQKLKVAGLFVRKHNGRGYRVRQDS